MRPFRGAAGSVVLLLSVVGCGGIGTSTSSTAATSTEATATETGSTELDLEPCAGSAPGLFAVEPSGVLRWRRCDESHSNQLLPISVADDLVYMVEQSGEEPSLVALNADDGTEAWRYQFSSLNEGFGYDAVFAKDAASFSAGGVIVLDVRSADGVDHVGLDARTGGERWRAVDDDGLVTLNTEELVVTSAGFGGDLAGSGPSGPVNAYDRRSGEQRWSATNVPYFGGSFGARVAGDTMVIQLYANAAPAGVMGLDLATGKERWRDDDRFWLHSASADVVVGVVGDFPASGGDVVALSPTDGAELWRASASDLATDTATETSTATTDTSNANEQSWTMGLAVDGTVVTQFGQVLAGFDARSGDQQWRRDSALSPIAGGDGQVLLAKRQSGVELVRAEDGTTRWSTSFSSTVDVRASVGDGITVLALVRMPTQPPTTDGSIPAYQDPVSLSIGCAGGNVLSGAFIAPNGPGQPDFGLTVLISADKSKFCVINSSGTEDVVPFERGRQVSEPEAQVVQGTLTDYLVVAVPPGWGQKPEVTTGQRQQLASAITPDGTVMLVLDYAPVGATPGQYVDRTFTFTDSERQTLDELTVAAPPTGSIDDVLSCLAHNGVRVAPLGMLDVGQLDKQPLDPTVTSAAWSVCRPLVLLWFQVSGQQPPQSALDSMDCMATKGFIEMFTAGEIDEAARAEAKSECSHSLPLAEGGLRCDIFSIDSAGALSTEPVRPDVLGFGAGAAATAPPTATVGAPITVTISALEAHLVDSGLGFAILDHRDIVRTFTISGATIVPGSLVADPAIDPGAEITATATTVVFDWKATIAGGEIVTFPAAHFDVVANAPGAVTVVFSSYDNTMRVRDSVGTEMTVRAMCTTDDRVLATITVT